MTLDYEYSPISRLSLNPEYFIWPRVAIVVVLCHLCVCAGPKMVDGGERGLLVLHVLQARVGWRLK